MSSSHFRSKMRQRALTGLLLVGATGAAVALAYMVITGWWQVAAVAVFALPALVIIHRYPFASVIIWLVLAPFLLDTETMVERYVYWGVHRALPPLTVGIIVLSWALRLRRRPLPRLGLAELAMAGYVVVSIVSIFLQNPSPEATLILFYDRIIVAMSLYLIVRLSEPTQREWRWLLLAAIFVVLSQSAVGVLSQFAPGLVPAKWMENAGERTVGTLINAAIYTIALMFGGLIALHSAQQAELASRRWILTICFMLTLFGTFLSYSRGSWLAGVLVAMVLVLVYPRFMIRLGVIGLPLAVLLGGVLFTSQLSWARERLYSDEAQNSASSRLPIMVGAYRMFEAKPLFGWGYGNFDRYDRTFYGRLLDSNGDNKDHASHNYFLTIAAEQGIMGFLFYLMPVAVWLTWTARRYKLLPVRGPMSRRLLIMLWLVILFHVVVSNFMNMIVVYGLGIWWVTLGLIGSLVESDRVAAPAEAPLPSGSRMGWRPVRPPLAPAPALSRANVFRKNGSTKRK